MDPLKLLLLFSVFSYVNSARILGVFHHASRSHHVLGETLLKELAQRGHEVTMISPYPQKIPIPNYRDIFTRETLEDMQNNIHNEWLQEFQRKSKSVGIFERLHEIFLRQAEKVFENKEVMDLFNNKSESFDVVIMDLLYNDGHLIFAEHFDCPAIYFATFGTSYLSDRLTGNSAPYAYVPYKFLKFTDDMTFLERIANSFLHIYSHIYDHFFIETEQEGLQKYFDNPPDIHDLFDRVALVFSNGHFAYETNRPLLPSMIDVGGIHVREPQKLEEHIENFLDSDFIYFSLGSNMQSSFLPDETLRAILKVFKNLKLKILWKFEKELSDVPSNVLISKWLPQVDVLAHKNIKLFITHGGLLSTIESIYFGVPLLGIPMWGDQHSNIATLVKFGLAKELLIENLNAENLEQSIMNVLNDSEQLKKAKLHSDLLRNQPIKPLDKAVFWVEHVIKHKGAEHLKAGSLKLTWYQHHLVDVTCFIISIVGLIIFVCVKICKFIYVTMKPKVKVE